MVARHPQTEASPRESEVESEGLHQPTFVPGHFLSRSFFGLFTTVVCTFLRALPIHSVSALNLLIPKKQVTPEAPYAGGLMKEVLSVVTHC